MKKLEKRKCFITGAASGIGRATAIAMGRLDAQLFLTDINAAGLEETVAIIRKEGGTVNTHKAFDITHYSEVRQFADEIHRAFGAMEIIMNIAGTSVWGLVENLAHQHWEKMIQIDLLGPIHVIECFLIETIREKKGGHLVNVASAAGLLGLPWHAPYSAAKYGLVGISDVLRFDLMQHNIGITLVCPGAVDTPLKHTVEIVGIDRSTPEAREMEKKFTERSVMPERVAELIIRGIRKNTYLVITSTDITILYWLKRHCDPLYGFIIKKLQKIIKNVSLASQPGC
jgi:NAD(P)-dependent dehydrogenase (short-subunit alcohol dehydrogenase family)